MQFSIVFVNVLCCCDRRRRSRLAGVAPKHCDVISDIKQRRIGLNCRNRARVCIDEDGLRRATRQRLKAECAGSSEHVSNADILDFLRSFPMLEQIENRFPDAIAGRAHVPTLGRLELTATVLTGDDPHHA